MSCFFSLFYSRHPEVKWAEREDKVFLTVMLPDAKNPKVNLEPNGDFTFSATAGPENHPYELKLNLHDAVNVEVRGICTATTRLCWFSFLDCALSKIVLLFLEDWAWKS